jgi:hypothetical protein
MVSPSQFKDYTSFLFTNHQIHEEACEMFYKYIYPKLCINFESKHALKRFRDIRLKHPDFIGTVTLRGPFSNIWYSGRDKRIDGIIRTIRDDVVKKNLLEPEEMDDKDNMLFHLAFKNREQGLFEHGGRFYSLKGEGWGVEMQWENNYESSWPDGKKVFHVSGHIGRLDTLWSRTVAPLQSRQRTITIYD